MDNNFLALWCTHPLFTALKDLNLLKYYTKNHEAGSILRVNLALSKGPHLYRAYLVTVCKRGATAVYSAIFSICTSAYFKEFK